MNSVLLLAALLVLASLQLMAFATGEDDLENDLLQILHVILTQNQLLFVRATISASSMEETTEMDSQGGMDVMESKDQWVHKDLLEHKDNLDLMDHQELPEQGVEGWSTPGGGINTAVGREPL